MRKILAGLIFGLLAGGLLGWILAMDKMRRQQQADQEAYANDPVLAAIRRERELDAQIDGYIENLDI